jgi:dolichol kinase
MFGKDIKVGSFEIRRKMVHAIAPLILLTFMASPYVFYYANLWVYQTSSTLYSTEILFNINKLGDIETSEGNYAAFHTIYLVLFGAVFVQLQSEFFEASFPNQPFILHKTILKHKRLNEQGALGHHVYMIVGFLGAFTILTYLQPPNNSPLIINCYYAIILSATFGDLTAALVGMQFGERHWGINMHKSYIGTAAGMGITYLTTFWFLGSFLAGLCVLVFIFTDLVLSKFKLCDNFWYPVLVAFMLRLFWAKIDPLVWLY